MSYNGIGLGLYELFSTTDWTDNEIVTVPENYTDEINADEWVRVHAVFVDKAFEGYGGIGRTSGYLAIEAFTAVDSGPTRGWEIADLVLTLTQLQYIEYQGLNIKTDLGFVSETHIDRDDSSLFRTEIRIPFKEIS